VSDVRVPLLASNSQNIGIQLQKRLLAPLAQSAEHIHGKEKPGLFSSPADQQEQPFVQVNADRSIWIK
jgi:hypothetical protein